ncbi:putative tetrahydroxynaphthalene reductase [Triangularia verruculosa]|uniref:Tetrahydroxynaphthalene reductase n=1 Tax=Triangularia verruculosa TaxID=2587418 RepID=A0AAN6XDE3_9PEZI|nr:putative tetrahydroxynaphthalene reductase [Triangularia verruculosa]
MDEYSGNLEGKVAIVTGSARGIGASIVTTLAQHGCAVVINYVNSERAAKTLGRRLNKEYDVATYSIQADISKPEEVAMLFEQTVKTMGKPDIVVCNAGVEHFGDLGSVTPEEIDHVFDTNVKGQFYVAQQAERFMKEGGRLILTSSISAVMGMPRHAIYAASKAAVTGMTKCLAWDLGKKKITVNCIAPGGVKSDMYLRNAKEYVKDGREMTMEDIDAQLSSWSPLGRVGIPDDIAGAVALLVSDEAGWITGQTLHVSGGAHMATA